MGRNDSLLDAASCAIGGKASPGSGTPIVQAAVLRSSAQFHSTSTLLHPCRHQGCIGTVAFDGRNKSNSCTSGSGWRFESPWRHTCNVFMEVAPIRDSRCLWHVANVFAQRRFLQGWSFTAGVALESFAHGTRGCSDGLDGAGNVQDGLLEWHEAHDSFCFHWAPLLRARFHPSALLREFVLRFDLLRRGALLDILHVHLLP